MSFWDPGRPDQPLAGSAPSSKRQCKADRSNHEPGGDPSRNLGDMMQGDALRGKGLIPHPSPAEPAERSEWEPVLEPPLVLHPRVFIDLPRGCPCNPPFSSPPAGT